MPDRSMLLQKILEITTKMRESALDSDWESVSERERYRRTLMERCFPLDGAIVDRAHAADSIQAIIALDKSVMSLAAHARKEVEQRLFELKLGRQASIAYTSVEIGR